MAAPTTQYARSGDVHLAYQVIGDGPRDVVLSLDWASHLEILWEQPFVQELVASLARFSRVLAGHGRRTIRCAVYATIA